MSDWSGKNSTNTVMETQPITSATRQVRQQWFSVGIFPPMLLFGLIPRTRDNPPLRVASYVMRHAKSDYDERINYNYIDNYDFFLL